MALHDWPQRWAKALLWKVKAGGRQIPARHAIADRYRKKYREAVRSVLSKMVKEAASRARGHSKQAFSANDLKRWAKAAYAAQIKILWQVVVEAYRLTGRELAGAKIAKATTATTAGPNAFLIRQAQPSVVEWLRDVASRQTARFADRIQEIMAAAQDYYDEETGHGMTPAEVADVLLEEGLAATETRAEMIARTNTIWAANEGALEKYDEAGVGAVEWLATEDDLTCDLCMELDGEAVEIGDAFADADGYEIEHPPLHPNCLVGPTPVVAPNHRAAFVAAYCGPIVEVRFSYGGRLACTVNHMLLTPRGFVAAGCLREGDEVFYCPIRNHATDAGPDDHREPTRIDEVVRALAESRGMTTKSVPASPEDLHGDAAFVNGDIHVIAPDRLLRSYGQSALSQGEVEPSLLGGTGLHGPLSCGGGLASVLLALRFASDRGVGCLGELATILRRGAGHAGEHAGAAVAWLNARLQELAADDVPGDTEAVGDGLFGFASQVVRHDRGRRIGERGNMMHPGRLSPMTQTTVSDDGALVALQDDPDCGGGTRVLPAYAGERLALLVALANVSFVHHESYSGHVYDLQTSSGLYLAGGAVAHNCRCTVVPVVV
jgi:SPP1 gp7 family putative phage head morphogenesis protein